MNSMTTAQKAFFDGREAFNDYGHDGESKNPYSTGSDEHDEWLKGFWEEANKGTADEGSL